MFSSTRIRLRSIRVLSWFFRYAPVSGRLPQSQFIVRQHICHYRVIKLPLVPGYRPSARFWTHTGSDTVRRLLICILNSLPISPKTSGVRMPGPNALEPAIFSLFPARISKMSLNNGRILSYFPIRFSHRLINRIKR